MLMRGHVANDDVGRWTEEHDVGETLAISDFSNDWP